jgi:hypothetical protein
VAFIDLISAEIFPFVECAGKPGAAQFTASEQMAHLGKRSLSRETCEHHNSAPYMAASDLAWEIILANVLNTQLPNCVL